jgi:hypothetical protein
MIQSIFGITSFWNVSLCDKISRVAGVYRREIPCIVVCFNDDDFVENLLIWVKSCEER